MKIVITITSAEISTLIQQHLAKEGMKVNVEDIKYSKGQAVVTADAPMEIRPDPPTSVEEIVEATEHVAARAPAPSPAPPALRPIDGGNATVDMSDVLRQSNKVAATTEGKFPAPKHAMLEGESTEPPNWENQ